MAGIQQTQGKILGEFEALKAHTAIAETGTREAGNGVIVQEKAGRNESMNGVLAEKIK